MTLPYGLLLAGSSHYAQRTRLQDERSGVERFSVKPGKVRLTTLQETRDSLDQDTQGRLAQLTTRLTKR
jgi:hypothetical protein